MTLVDYERIWDGSGQGLNYIVAFVGALPAGRIAVLLDVSAMTSDVDMACGVPANHFHVHITRSSI